MDIISINSKISGKRALTSATQNIKSLGLITWGQRGFVINEHTGDLGN